MIWKPIKRYPGYEVSSTGLVRNAKGNHKVLPGFILTPACVSGYPVVSMYGPNGKRQERVHRLVAEAFLHKSREEQTIVAHNDGVRDNNNAENLRWATQTDNLSDRVAHGTEIRCEKNGRAKLTRDIVLEIRRRYKPRCKKNGAKVLAKEFGVTDVAIIKAFRGENWGKFT